MDCGGLKTCQITITTIKTSNEREMLDKAQEPYEPTVKENGPTQLVSYQNNDIESVREY